MSTDTPTDKASGSVSRAARFAIEVAQWDLDALRKATQEMIGKTRPSVLRPRPSDEQYDHDIEKEHGWSVK